VYAKVRLEQYEGEIVRAKEIDHQRLRISTAISGAVTPVYKTGNSMIVPATPETSQ
jgi:hypothetical protein